MISKHIKGREFSRCLHYVLEKPGAQRLGGNLFSMTSADASVELNQVARQNQRTTRPLLHCALSLAPGESLSAHQWRMLTQDYLKALGFTQNQYLLVRHTDTPSHEHVHLIVNRVRLNGKTVSDSWDYMRSQVVVRQLETEYGLVHAPLSWEKRKQKCHPMQFNPPVFSEPPIETLPPSVQQQVKWQRQLRGHLNGVLVTAYDLPSLTEQLTHQGVQLRLLHRQGKAVGISFEWQGQTIAGSRLGAAYSLPRLLAVMDLVARPTALSQTVLVQGHDIHNTDNEIETEIHQFEPDETLPVAQQRYGQLEMLVRQQSDSSVTQRQIDLQIAQWSLRSTRPDEARALIYSPDVQRIRRLQGDASALDYLKQLMKTAQRQFVTHSEVQGREGQER